MKLWFNTNQWQQWQHGATWMIIESWCKDNSMTSLWEFNASSVRTQCKINYDSMAIHSEFNDSSIMSQP